MVKSRDYVSAAKVAEQIEWKKMKQWSVMSNAINAFVATGKFDKARNVCIYAYNRRLGGRRLLATLMDMYVRLGEYEDAEEIYQEYSELAPRDVTRYILLYRLRRAQEAPTEELIEILQEYKEKELDEEYEYELALLYSKAGMADKCVKECDELVLWFADGIYVEKALRLKQMYVPLSTKQAEKLARLVRMSAVGNNSPDVLMADEQNSAVYEAAAAEEEDVQQYAKEAGAEADADYEAQYAEETEPAYVEQYENENESEEYAAYQEHSAAYQEQAEEDISDGSSRSSQENPEKKYVDDIGNTTEWSPIEIYNAIEEAKESEQKLSGTKTPGTKTAEPEQNISDMVPVGADMQQADGDYDININIPDYSVYDTRNVQQELKENVKEIMEAYNNREKTEALREASELQETLELQDVSELQEVSEFRDVSGDSDPTKEIIINKHQWRKASRNVVHKKDIQEQDKAVNTASGKDIGALFKLTSESNIRDVTRQMTLEQMEELVAQLQAEQERRRKEAADNRKQADVQMDISQWLSDYDGDAGREDDPEPVEPEDIKTRDKSTEEMETRQQSAAEPQSEEKTEPEAENADYNPAERAAVEQTVREIAASMEKEKKVVNKYGSDAGESIEDEFEEIPDVEESFDEEYDYEYKTADVNKSDELPDLEKAINDGIEKIIDDTIKGKNTGYDYDSGRYFLRDEEKRFLDKYLYMSGMERRLCRYIGAKRAEKQGNQERAGNIAIMGSRSTDKTAFAVNLFKAIHVYDEKLEQKLARISAETLNEKGFASYADKLAGHTLIIEDAGRLKHEQIDALMHADRNDTTLIIEDEEFGINKLFAENPDFSDLFTGCFLLKQYTVNELVDIAKDYADEQSWRVEDKALLKLYLILSRIPNDDQGNAVGIVKEIMDRAAAHAERSIGNRLFGRFRSVLVIKETDFVPIDEDEEYDGEEDKDEVSGYDETYDREQDGDDFKRNSD